MGKKKANSTTEQFVVLTGEQFKELTPEAQAQYLEALNARNEALAAENSKLAKKAAKAEAVASKAKPELPTLEVEEDDDSDIEPGTYQWTAPTLTWDDGKVYKAVDLMADAEGEDEKAQQKAQTIIAQLLARKSGLLVRKED